jgi:hypothetical protein
VVHQICGRLRQIIGSFELSIPVKAHFCYSPKPAISLCSGTFPDLSIGAIDGDPFLIATLTLLRDTSMVLVEIQTHYSRRLMVAQSMGIALNLARASLPLFHTAISSVSTSLGRIVG